MTCLRRAAPRSPPAVAWQPPSVGATHAATAAQGQAQRGGVPQSLPQLPQITAPPQLLQITAPPQPPINISFDNMFGGMLENMMMPREYGYKSQSYVSDNIDEDVMDALPPPQQDKYIEKQKKPQIVDQLKDIEFDNEDDKLKVYKQADSNKTAKA
jgi:hypothetical protein